jgi:hypothetical protein
MGGVFVRSSVDVGGDGRGGRKGIKFLDNRASYFCIVVALEALEIHFQGDKHPKGPAVQIRCPVLVVKIVSSVAARPLVFGARSHEISACYAASCAVEILKADPKNATTREYS